MSFLHDGRPPVIRDAIYSPSPVEPLDVPDLTAQRKSRVSAGNHGQLECRQQGMGHTTI